MHAMRFTTSDEEHDELSFAKTQERERTSSARAVILQMYSQVHATRHAAKEPSCAVVNRMERPRVLRRACA